MDSSYSYRAAKADDWQDIYLLLADSFIDDLSEEFGELERSVFEPERTVLAETAGPDDSTVLAGIASTFTRDVVTPGGSTPAAHVTLVSVSGMHRRRGILRQMISWLHADAIKRGEPVAMLWASEGRIYQRFGYGLAAARLRLEIDKREAQLRPDAAPSGRGVIRRIPNTDTATLARVFDRIYLERPGWSSRDAKWWAYVTADPKEGRQGATALRVSVHEGPDGPDGYMLWRVKNEWGVTPAGIVRVRELVATNPEAYRALWQHALSVDLTRHVHLAFGAIDEPLLYLLDEPRAATGQLSESLWVRILSVPDALTARRYAAPVDVVLDVRDADVPTNARRWRLTGSPDEAACAPTDEPADLSLDISALGAAYLGGSSLAALAAGGRVTELTPGALAAASTAFGWPRAPQAIEMF